MPTITSTTKPDQVINLPAGTHDGIVVRHPGCTIRGAGPEATIIDGRGQLADGIRGRDGCSGLTVENLGIVRCGTGAFITTAENVTLRNLIVRHCGAEGLQGGALSNLLVEDCLSEGHGKERWNGPPLGIGPNRSHAFYFEAKGTGWEDGKRGMTMRRCQGRQCNGMGLHGRGSYLRVEGCEFTENRPGNDRVGAGDVQLTSVAHARLIRCLLEGGDSGLTLYGGTDEDPDPCFDVAAQDCAIWEPEGAFAVSAWAGVRLAVIGGLVVGRLDKTPPAFAMLAEHFPTAAPAATAALAAWRTGSAPPPPVPEPQPEDTTWQTRFLAEKVRADGLAAEVERLETKIRAALLLNREQEEALKT